MCLILCPYPHRELPRVRLPLTRYICLFWCDRARSHFLLQDQLFKVVQLLDDGHDNSGITMQLGGWSAPTVRKLCQAGKKLLASNFLFERLASDQKLPLAERIFQVEDLLIHPILNTFGDEFGKNAQDKKYQAQADVLEYAIRLVDVNGGVTQPMKTVGLGPWNVKRERLALILVVAVRKEMHSRLSSIAALTGQQDEELIINKLLDLDNGVHDVDVAAAIRVNKLKAIADIKKENIFSAVDIESALPRLKSAMQLRLKSIPTKVFNSSMQTELPDNIRLLVGDAAHRATWNTAFQLLRAKGEDDDEDYEQQVKLQSGSPLLIVGSPPWASLGDRRYGNKYTDTALLESEVKSFGKYAARFMGYKCPSIMALHMPVSMAGQWSGLMSEFWSMSETPMVFMRPGGWLPKANYANMRVPQFESLSPNMDFFWIFTKHQGELPRGKSNWSFPRAYTDLGASTAGVLDLARAAHTSAKYSVGATERAPKLLPTEFVEEESDTDSRTAGARRPNQRAQDARETKTAKLEAAHLKRVDKAQNSSNQTEREVHYCILSSSKSMTLSYAGFQRGVSAWQVLSFGAVCSDYATAGHSYLWASVQDHGHDTRFTPLILFVYSYSAPFYCDRARSHK